MFVVANFLEAIAVILNMVLQLYMWVIIARAVISWVNPDPYNPIVQFLHRVTDPLLYKVRRFMPDFGGIDFSPIIVIMAIVFLQSFLVQTLSNMARALK
jgi:YggT family protein